VLPPAECSVLTNAAVSAATRLGLTNACAGKVLGLSASSVSRMKSGRYVLRSAGKARELAVMLVRVWRALDIICAGDGRVARAWLRSDNQALGGPPVAMITSVSGLANVLAYLEARRSR
jgi:hypothetical protein